MKIEVNVEKKHAFLIVGALLLFTSFFVVYAYGGNEPSVVGHTGGELEFTGENVDWINDLVIQGRIHHPDVTRDDTFLNVRADDKITLGTGGDARLVITNDKTDVKNTIQIRGGNPGAGKVLTSTDGGGNAVWQNVGGAADTASCTLVGSSGNDDFVSVNVPEECKGEICSLLLVSIINPHPPLFGMVEYIQEVPGVSVSGYWYAHGLETSNQLTVNDIARIGRNGDGGQDAIIDLGDIFTNGLYDDHGGVETAEGKWTIKSVNDGAEVRLYRCQD